MKIRCQPPSSHVARNAIFQVPFSAFVDSKNLTALILTILRPSFFKTLVDHEVTVELKNDISIKGVLKSVDQFLNIKLDDIQVVEELKYPHLVSPASYCFRLQTTAGILRGADG